MKKRYIELANEYLKAFCERYDFHLEDTYWVADEPGIAGIIDYYFNYDTIRYCVDNKVDWDTLIDWYDYTIATSGKGVPTPNIKAWCSGCPRLTRDEINELYKCQDRLAKILNKVR